MPPPLRPSRRTKARSVLHPAIIYMGFIAADFADSVGGYAYLDTPGLPFGIVRNPGFSTITTTIIAAHEAAHVLGGLHADAVPGSLLAATLDPNQTDLPAISAANTESLRASSLLAVTPMPLSGSAVMLLAAALALFSLRKGRTSAQRLEPDRHAP